MSVPSPGSVLNRTWLFGSLGARGEKFPKGSESRVARLIDLGIIERGKGRTYILSRRFYDFVGKKGAYTRKKGLDREHNLALLLKHIDDNKASGSRLTELCQVIPSLPKTHVQSLLQTLKRRGAAHPVGQRRAGVWYPGPFPDEAAETEGENDA